MNNKIKLTKLFIMAILFALILGISGCKDNGTSNNQNDLDNNQNNTPVVDPHKGQELSILDIDWEVKIGVSNGKRYALCEIFNNTSFTIWELKIDLRPTNDLSKEKLNEFYLYFQTTYKFDDEEMNELIEDGVLRIEIVYNGRYNDMVPIASNSSIDNERIKYYGVYYALDLEWYSYFTPSIATIMYEKEGNIYTLYYDYLYQTYTLDKEVISFEDYKW